MKSIDDLKKLLTGKFDYILDHQFNSHKCSVRFCVEETRYIFSFQINLMNNTMYVVDQAGMYTSSATPIEVLELYVRVHDFAKASGIEIVR